MFNIIDKQIDRYLFGQINRQKDRENLEHMVCTFSNLLLQVWNSAKCEIHFDIHRVLRKKMCFPNPLQHISRQHISARDLRSMKNESICQVTPIVWRFSYTQITAMPFASDKEVAKYRQFLEKRHPVLRTLSYYQMHL